MAVPPSVPQYRMNPSLPIEKNSQEVLREIPLTPNRPCIRRNVWRGEPWKYQQSKYSSTAGWREWGILLTSSQNTCIDPSRSPTIIWFWNSAAEVSHLSLHGGRIYWPTWRTLLVLESVEKFSTEMDIGSFVSIAKGEKKTYPRSNPTLQVYLRRSTLWNDNQKANALKKFYQYKYDGQK